MCRKGRIAILLTCVLLLGQLFLEGAVSGQDLNVGDHWEYEYEEDMDDFDLDGTMRMEVTGFDTVTVGGVSYETVVITSDADGTFSADVDGVVVSGTWTIDGKSYHQKTNHEEVKRILDYEMDGTATYQGDSYDFSANMHNTSDYHLLIDQREPDPKVGDLGSSKSSVTSHSTSHMEIAGSTDDSSEDCNFIMEKYYNCIKKEKVTVPAGKFQTYLIRTSKSDGSYQLSWYSEEVGASVKMEDYNEKGERQGKVELTSYQFGASGSGKAEDTIFGLSPTMFNLMIIAVIVVIIIIVIIAVKRRGGKAPESAAGGQQPQYAPPPPQQQPPPPPPPR